MHDYFLNLQHYIDLLPLNEQFVEINNMIRYYSKERQSLPNFRQRFSILKGLKSIKQEILSTMQTYTIIITYNLYKTDSTIDNHIKELNIRQYKDQCAYIAKKLISLEPNDIKHLDFFKRLQIIITDLPHIVYMYMSNLSIGCEKAYSQCYNSNMFHDYFSHKIDIHIAITYKRVSTNEYLVTTPIKNHTNKISPIVVNNASSEDEYVKVSI